MPARTKRPPYITRRVATWYNNLHYGVRLISLMTQKLLTIVILTLTILTLSFSQAAFADDTVNGAEIFSVHCAGCHINGGNIVRRGKNLKQKTLKRDGMDSVEAIASIVTNGKNNMSAYKDRLTEQEIQEVSAYVLSQAEKGWH